MSLQNVDFTHGIRAEVINNNFEYLNNKMKNDRLLILGRGIAHGFNISVDPGTFIIDVTGGNLITETGDLQEVAGVNIPINLSYILQTVTENVEISNNLITLTDVPYANNGKKIAYNDVNPNIHVTLKYANLTPVPFYSFESPNTISINGANGTAIVATYYIARAMCYAIYIDTNNTIQCYPSIASTSPSIYQLSNFQYYLGVVKIIPYISGNTELAIQVNNIDRVKIYVDSSNDLYVNGKRFEDLTHIYLVEPENPKENDIWYDTTFGANTLKVWRIIGGVPGWINVNDYTYINNISVKLWNPEHESYNSDTIDGKYFVFDRDETEMFFYGSKNELSVVVDNGVINSDQFEPITAEYALYLLEAYEEELSAEDIRLKNILINTGYTLDNTTSLIYNVDGYGNIISEKEPGGSICIGFELLSEIPVNLSNPYNKQGPYVEATVHHSFTTSSVQSKLQRNALFVDENSMVYSAGSGDTFETNRYYLVGENQLEVFVDGIKLDKSTEIHPNGSFTELQIDASKRSNRFRINRAIGNGSIVTYRISKNIYTYDNDFVDNIAKGIINTVFTTVGDMQDTLLDVPIKPADHITAYNSQGQVLIRKISENDNFFADYVIIENNGNYYFRNLNTDKIGTNETIYITGVKYSL